MGERVFVLPDLGEGLEEAVVTGWLVSEGDMVELNQPFAEIETAKATVEIPSPFAGRVAKLHVTAGDTLAVGAPLVTFEVADGPAVGSQPVGATPAVRKLAKDLRVDLSSIAGSGPGGRVTREDVEHASAGEAAAGDDDELVPVTTTRRTIARNLEEIARIPQVTTFRTVDCTGLDALRHELGTSPLPVFIRALAEVCTDHPWINASWGEDRIRIHHAVHVGIATDTERGLVVPVLRDAGSRSIGEIAAEVARLAEAARTNTLTPPELAGATIAVTNTGSYGSESGTPLLHPGHAVTIALGIIAPRALVVDGAVTTRPACTLSLTFDHRVLDGATVGRALGALVELVESRERLGSLPR
ncbi:MAG: 2-oxo acid dehydrogenase subunit E2 [Actinobacteria bacterium]|nr:2-oxo acid dehydrogenase subunit E2 [Actinomycetota bacterium]